MLIKGLVIRSDQREADQSSGSERWKGFLPHDFAVLYYLCRLYELPRLLSSERSLKACNARKLEGLAGKLHNELLPVLHRITLLQRSDGRCLCRRPIRSGQ